MCTHTTNQVALKLIETFTEKCEDPALIASMYVPAMMDPILGDYQRAVPDARCGSVSVCVGVCMCESLRAVVRYYSCMGFLSSSMSLL
jgi:hypothetical protein